MCLLAEAELCCKTPVKAGALHGLQKIEHIERDGGMGPFLTSTDKCMCVYTFTLFGKQSHEPVAQPASILKFQTSSMAVKLPDGVIRVKEGLRKREMKGGLNITSPC